MTRPDELLPERATFGPRERVRLEWRGDRSAARLVVTRLGDVVLERSVEPADWLDLGVLAKGGYAVRLVHADGSTPATTAFDVLDSPVERPRYGFLSEFGPARTDEENRAAGEGLRALHLNVVQFYDWAYRHADLVGADQEFTDACGRRLSHATTRALIHTCHAVGAQALGYAAVYGVGTDHADEHPDHLLYHRDGERWMLADLLAIGDVARGNPWRDHILEQFAKALTEMPFDGLHLDTYGSPKIAWDYEGRAVDLADEFPSFLEDTREALPHATLFFNNVNDYPTWATVSAPLDSTYVEVWDPHREYSHLVGLVEAARLAAPGRPVVLAAYLTPFARGDDEAARWSARLALATVFAHGGHYLLCGEGDGVLVHPYYPQFVRVGTESGRVLRQYLDFAVANGDVLYAPEAKTVTHAHFAGDENDDLAVETVTCASPDPRAGSVWTVARTSALGMTVHLVDLRDQQELEWNVPKNPGRSLAGVEVRVRWAGERMLFGSPDHGPALTALDVTRDGDYLVATLPGFIAWGMVHLPRE